MLACVLATSYYVYMCAIRDRSKANCELNSLTCTIQFIWKFSLSLNAHHNVRRLFVLIKNPQLTANFIYFTRRSLITQNN